MKQTKLKCERRMGRVTIKCPSCHTVQELAIGREDYTIDPKGRVHPDFVCMKADRSCGFMAPIWIVNW